MPSLNYEYQPIASEILTQLSRYKRAEGNLLADEKDLHHLGQAVVWVKHIFLYIYYSSYLDINVIISPNTILLYGIERQDLYELKTTVLLL